MRPDVIRDLMAAIGGPRSLETMTDLELRGLPGGDALDAIATAERIARARLTGAVGIPVEDVDILTLTWGDLKVTNPEYLGEYWAECRALYAGGSRLFRADNAKVFERLFPSNMYEDQLVYAERKKRAHYFPYPGTILDNLVAGLSSDALRVSWAETDDKGAIKITADGEWWESWVQHVKRRPSDGKAAKDAKGKPEQADVTKAGCSLHELMLEVVREAEQVRTAWLRCCEAPGPDADPYFDLVPAEQVIDWQEDDDHELEWVMTRCDRSVRNSMRARRQYTEATFTIYSVDGWVEYVVVYDPKTPPADELKIKPTDAGSYSFGCVPFVRFELPEGQWGMGKMHSPAREHFNKRCAMAWAEYKSLFQILYEFQGAEEGTAPVSIAQQDPSRGTNQIRAQGYTQVRGKDDRAEYVGPDPMAFTSARESCADIMREMHRVMFSMALSANMDKAALQRSGESKQEDNVATEVLLDALGVMIRACARRMISLVALLKDTPSGAPPYEVSGLEHFDVQGVADAIAEATALFAGVPIKSPKFAELYLADLYCKALGDRATQDVREEIREQVRDQLDAETMLADAVHEASLEDPTGQGLDDPNADEPPPKAKAEPKAEPGGGVKSRPMRDKPKR